MATAEEIRAEWKELRSGLGNLICHIEGRISQLEALEKKTSEENAIHFGDEVEAWDLNSWVQFIAVGDEGDGWMVGFDREGGSYRYPVESCRKTGKRWKVIKDGE